MDSVNVQKLMLDIVKEYLSGTKYTKQLTDENFAEVFALLKKHDIAHIGGVVLSEQIELNEKAKSAFTDIQFMAVMRYEKNKYEREAIYKAFEDEKIPFVPLKGAIICDFYPESWHRTSCDIDVLVQQRDISRAVEVLEKKLGYRYDVKSEHDEALFSPSGVHVEVHYDFLEEEIDVNDAWKAASVLEGWSYQYRFSWEFFVFHNIAHLAKHFKYAGCGVRSFIDLWIMKHNMKYDADKLDEMLKSYGLKKFADLMYDIIEVWFGDKQSNEFLDNVSDYILNAGVYGNLENRVTIGQIKKKSRIRYIFSRIFLRYDVLKYGYPILEKHRWLMPFCHIHRWLSNLKPSKIRGVRNELELHADIDNEQRKNIAKLLGDLDLI